jgi:hypothetical protein
VLEDPGWGPTVPDVREGGHVLAPGPPPAVASSDGVTFAGARIDALVLCEGAAHRTAEPTEVSFGLAQVRRVIEAGDLRVVHVVFAPLEPRPILLGLVRLANGTDQALGVEYVELWDVEGGGYRASPGACERRTPQGLCVLADAGAALRAEPPDEPPSRGLALELILVLPPRSARTLEFAYAAPGPEDRAELLVRAWRGRVANELTDVVRSWTAHLGCGPEAVYAFRG